MSEKKNKKSSKSKNVKKNKKAMVAKETAKSRFVIKRCKREEYIRAWNHMYSTDKDKFNKNPIYDGVNPALNKVPLATETDNFCTVAYDTSIPTEGFEYGKPVGIFCFVVTPRKVIGKQFVVHPDYLGKGLGKALLLENEKTLIDNGFSWYYIGCSNMSARIMKSFGREPYSSDEEHDMYKFNVDLKDGNFDRIYNSVFEKYKDITVV